MESVLARLQEAGLNETPLASEWQAIQETDDDETAFCMAAARLGLDPYGEAKPYEDDILHAATVLPTDLFGDFMDAVEPEGINLGLNQGRGFQAFGSRDSDAGPSVVLSRHSRDTARRFVLARAMWHIICGESHDFLVTSAYTDKQKMERAFAAELLAPAAGVAELVGGYPSADDQMK